jgi:hypothetical protein
MKFEVGSLPCGRIDIRVASIVAVVMAVSSTGCGAADDSATPGPTNASSGTMAPQPDATGNSTGASTGTTNAGTGSPDASMEQDTSTAPPEASADTSTSPPVDAGSDMTVSTPPDASDDGASQADAPVDAPGIVDAPPDTGPPFDAASCFDGGKAPTSWPIVFADLFGPGTTADGGYKTPGHCGNANCHGSPNDAGYMNSSGQFDLYKNWTAKGMYAALTTQMTQDGVLVDLEAGAANAVLGDIHKTPLSWFGPDPATGIAGGMPQDWPHTDLCLAAEVTAWLKAGAPSK